MGELCGVHIMRMSGQRSRHNNKEAARHSQHGNRAAVAIRWRPHLLLEMSKKRIACEARDYTPKGKEQEKERCAEDVQKAHKE